MAVCCDEILACAEDIVTNMQGEAALRTAAGRAYYAAYHKAAVFYSGLKSPGRLPKKKKGMHRTLIHQLKNPTDASKAAESRLLGKLLEDIYAGRIQADYRLNDTVKENDVRVNIALSKRVLQTA